METNICKFPHKIYHSLTHLAFKTGPRILLQTGVLAVGQLNGVIQMFARPTLVAMVTKISKIQQKIGCV